MIRSLMKGMEGGGVKKMGNVWPLLVASTPRGDNKRILEQAKRKSESERRAEVANLRHEVSVIISSWNRIAPGTLFSSRGHFSIWAGDVSEVDL